MNLEGKVVLITGGRRVGGELAKLLARKGAHVALTYHTSRDAIARTVEEVERLGVRGLAVEADLSRAEQAERAVSEVVAQFGRLDALVNMASIYKKTPFATLVPSDFDEMIAANLAAPYHAAVSAAKAMLRQPAEGGPKGKIINMGDWATERPRRDYLPYMVAKGGLTTLTLTLAKELAPHITVNLVQPATIDPPPDWSEAERDAIVAQTPLAKLGTPDDANRLILYLLEGTDFATGSCYRIDGGRFLGMDGGET